MLKRLRGAGYLLTAGLMLAGGIVPAFSQTAAQPSGATAVKAGSEDEVTLLKQQVALQQKQISELQAAMAEMKKRMDRTGQAPQFAAAGSVVAAPAAAVPGAAAPAALPPKSAATAPAALTEPRSLGQVASLTPVVPKAPKTAEPAFAGAPVMSAADPRVPSFYNNGASPTDEEGLSPLSVKIGGATFTPGGFLDFTTFGRSTNLGSGIGSSFGSIPYSNATAGQLSETRFTMQNSRISLDVNSKYLGFDLHGHIEADFLGFAPPNLNVTSNSNTLRSRLYWIDARKGNFEFLGGQAWSMLTPNRTGLSANPSDIFYSQDMDTNYQVGLTWARQAQFRLIYHFNDMAAAGISIENPQQLYGNATVPSSLVAEGDNGSGSITNSNAANNPATPNLMPDIIGKIAFDPKSGDLHQHIEIAGLLTSARTYDPTAKVRNTATGGGVSVNVNFELVKNLHAIVNTFYSDGGGRYIFGLGPGFIIDRNAAGDYQPSLVHSGSGIAGFEYQVNKATMFYGYYGGAYYGRDFGIDCYTQPIPPMSPTGTVAACNQTPSSSPVYDGFGFPKSSNSQNRDIQEGTFGVIQTFWKNPHYGSLQLITQYSYLTRTPWYIASGAPKNAHLSMGYVDLRYVLP
jgi:hypothetical protein